MKHKILVLANSYRPSGRCIAGIDIDSEKWIRPVDRNKDRAAPSSINGLKVLDVIEIDLDETPILPPDKYQIENRIALTWKIKQVGTGVAEDVLKYCSKDDLVLYSKNDRVSSMVFKSKPTNEWISLQLVKAKAQFIRDPKKEDHWRAQFHDNAGNKLTLKCTDAFYCSRLDQGDKPSKFQALAISLAGPWSPPNSNIPEFCYKLVAGVIELPELQ